jgi:hypothetical protein
MGRIGTAVRSAAIGAGLMYLFDPERGRRRRARLRDQAVHLNRELVDMVDTAQRDFKHRAEGMVARVRSTFETGTADDRVLQARVRAELGRLVSHPGAIHVEARDGVVTLTGPILREEVRGLLSGVESVRGVTRVISHLEPHDSAENVPMFERPRSGCRSWTGGSTTSSSSPPASWRPSKASWLKPRSRPRTATTSSAGRHPSRSSTPGRSGLPVPYSDDREISRRMTYRWGSSNLDRIRNEHPP